VTAYSAITSNKRRSFGLIIVFVVFVILLGWLIDRIQGGGTIIFPFAILISVISALTGYFAGDKIALAANSAQQIAKADSPELYRIVENLAITAGIQTPKVYIIPSPAINAFATGRDPKHASVAVTVGALEKLDQSELEGVLAHEFSHIDNYDIRLMTVVAIFVGTIALVSDMFLRARLFGFRGRDNNREEGNLGIIIAIIGFVLILLSPIIAQLIQLAISRKREFLADASGVLLTRYPQGLISAFRKIEAEQIPVASANSATAHLYLTNPLSGRAISKLFSTHPPIEERIAALEKMG
jgi:heat shock protein HtpX